MWDHGLEKAGGGSSSARKKWGCHLGDMEGGPPLGGVGGVKYTLLAEMTCPPDNPHVDPVEWVWQCWRDVVPGYRRHVPKEQKGGSGVV